MAFLDVEDVFFTYYTGRIEHVALGGVTLSADPTDFVAIVGPSGCGKSTLLNIVAGYLEPSAGHVRLGARNISGPGADRGVVFQRSSLFPWMTVRGNVEFGLKLAGIERTARREIAMKYLRLVGLEKHATGKVYHLSGGMRQRVELARALANNPELLLMDEPMGALDALSRERTQELLLRIWRDTKKAMLLITHNVEEAVFLGTKVLVMAGPPGRFIRSFDPPFSRAIGDYDPREIKSKKEFIEFKEEVLRLVLNTTE